MNPQLSNIEPRAAYKPNEASRTRAYEEVRRAVAEATLAISEIAKGLKRIEKAKRGRSADLADSYETGKEVEKQVAELEKAKADVQGVKSRLDGYVDSFGKLTLPTDAKAQGDYDRKMGGLREAAFKTRRIIETVRKSSADRVAGCVAALRGDIVGDDE